MIRWARKLERFGAVALYVAACVFAGLLFVVSIGWPLAHFAAWLVKGA